MVISVLVFIGICFFRRYKQRISQMETEIVNLKKMKYQKVVEEKDLDDNQL